MTDESSDLAPDVLVVHESMFGNTTAIARAVAAGLAEAGLAVSVGSVLDTEAVTADRVRLLVLGAPTHAFSLSRASTRSDAVRQGGAATAASHGMREWVADLPRAGEHPPVVAVFDTRVAKVRRWPMNAASKLGRLVRQLGYHLVVSPEGFLVEDTPGPLVAGEEDRAQAWGRHLGRAVGAATVDVC